MKSFETRTSIIVYWCTSNFAHKYYVHDSFVDIFVNTEGDKCGAMRRGGGISRERSDEITGKNIRLYIGVSCVVT